MAIPSPVLGTDSFLAWRTATNDIIGELNAVPKDNLNASTEPTAFTDSDAGYSVSSTWIDTTLDIIYVCVDSTPGAAIWSEVALAGAHAIETSTDTTISSVEAGDLLQWDGSSWINNTLAEASISPASHNHTLDSLSNTNIVSNEFGEVLKWDGTNWINNTLAEADIATSTHNHTLGSLSDLTITSVGTNEIISWDGSSWINKTFAEAGIEPANANITKKNVAESIGSIWAFNGGTSGINAPFTTDSTYVVTNLNADLLDGQEGAWYSPATHNHTLDSLTNTVITSNSTGEVLKWDGDNWINNTLAEAGIEPANANITKKNVAESIGSIWAFNGGLSGSTSPFTVDSNTRVVNLNADLLDGQEGAWYSPATHNHTLDSLTNTVITSNSTGEVLKWDGDNWINNTLAEAGIEPANASILKTADIGVDVQAYATALSNVSGTNTGDQIAIGVANTPEGDISATNVQSAINELDSEKVATANLLTEMKAVDGAGSGLDADLLDGLDSNRFMRSEAIAGAIGSVDLNTLFMTQTAYIDASCTNKPSATVGCLIITGNSVNRSGQSFISQDGDMYYRRSDDGTAWSAWERLATFNDFTSSIATNGYQKLPSGLIIQWGGPVTIPNSGGEVSITFPIAFPTAFLHAFVSVRNAAGQMCGFDSESLTGMVLRTGGSDTLDREGHWLAIGY